MNPNPETTYCVDLYPEGVTVGTLDRLLTANHLIGTDLIPYLSLPYEGVYPLPGNSLYP